MILKTIQQHLQSLYQLHLEQNVEDFLTVTPFREGAGIQIKSRFAQEALLIRQMGNEIELGLFISPAILLSLQKQNPFQKLDNHNLKNFMIAVEGVSHFIYLVMKVKLNQPVSQLELELQAEIDKYLLVGFLFFQHQGKIPGFLFSYLFENFRCTPFLNQEAKFRYLEANRLATKFCAYLDQNYLRYQNWPKAIEQARHFYHLNHWSKIAQLTP